MKTFFFILIFVFSGLAPAKPAGPQVPLDIVVDLDGTLVYFAHESKGAFQFGEHNYGWRPFAKGFIEGLLRIPNARISFFSGGDQDRNLDLLGRLCLENGKTAKEIAYRILSREDLTQISSDEKLRFSERYKKDLRKINPDLRRVILVDDISWFALPGQSANVLRIRAALENRDDLELENALKAIQRVEESTRRDPLQFVNKLRRDPLQRRCERIFE